MKPIGIMLLGMLVALTPPLLAEVVGSPEPGSLTTSPTPMSAWGEPDGDFFETREQNKNVKEELPDPNVQVLPDEVIASIAIEELAPNGEPEVIEAIREVFDGSY